MHPEKSLFPISHTIILPHPPRKNFLFSVFPLKFQHFHPIDKTFHEKTLKKGVDTLRYTVLRYSHNRTTDTRTEVITIGKREYTPARAEANAKYDAKTYRQINFRLRLDDDADIIKSIDQAKESGLNNREWLRELFEGNK